MIDEHFIEAAENAAWDVARARIPERLLRPGALTRAIQSLSSAYTAFHAPTTDARNANERDPRALPSRKAHVASPLDDEARLAAQLLFFTIADLPKPWFPLRELSRLASDWPAANATLRVLDLGAGCGAMSLGLLGTLVAHQRTEITAVDADSAALALFAELAARLSTRADLGIAPFDVHTKQLQLDRRANHHELGGRYDLVIAGSVLAELSDDAALRLLEHVLDHCLGRHGRLVVIEPALRETARRLHALRDSVLGAGKAVVLGPCVHQSRCPVLQRETDWCHEARVWQVLPPKLRQLAADTHLRRRDIKLAYLTLAASTDRVPNLAALLAPGPHEMVSRVVSHQLRSKGKREVFVCNDLGRWPAVRLDRHRRSENRCFEDLTRGMLLALPRESAAEGRLRIRETTTVRCCDPASPSTGGAHANTDANDNEPCDSA